MKVNALTRKVEIRTWKKLLAVGQNTHGYILTYCRL